MLRRENFRRFFFFFFFFQRICMHCSVNTIAIKWTLVQTVAIKRFFKIDNLCTFIITYENANNGNATAKSAQTKRVKVESESLKKENKKNGRHLACMGFLFSDTAGNTQCICICVSGRFRALFTLSYVLRIFLQLTIGLMRIAFAVKTNDAMTAPMHNFFLR